GHVLVPAIGLGARGATARCCNAVELGALALVRDTPLGLDPTPLFHAVERGVEGAIENAEGALGSVTDEASDRVAVHGSPAEGAEDEHVERSLQEVELVRRHGP